MTSGTGTSSIVRNKAKETAHRISNKNNCHAIPGLKKTGFWIKAIAGKSGCQQFDDWREYTFMDVKPTCRSEACQQKRVPAIKRIAFQILGSSRKAL
eukprot:scaffold8412_cov14-Tisochrysis_lutea.AAC.1